MSRDDRQKWDARWAELGGSAPPDALLQEVEALLSGGVALDLACGRGQNALWLAAHGYRVLAVDGSRVALSAGQEEGTARGLDRRVLFVHADLDLWRPPPLAFDLIAVFRFLDRSLFASLRAALRPDGLLFYATRHRGVLRWRPDATEAFLLREGELPSHFPGWEIVHHEEGAKNTRFVARKPPGENGVSRETGSNRGVEKG